MHTAHPHRLGTLDHPLARQHLITVLDQSLWLLQWAANTPTLTTEERQNVERRLVTLEKALRAVLEPQPPPEPSGSPTSET